MHQNLKWLSQIEGAFLKFNNQKRFLFRPRASLQAKKQAQKSHATVPLNATILHPNLRSSE
jgi:hypothetical protein